MTPRTILVVEGETSDSQLLAEILHSAFGDTARVLTSRTTDDAKKLLVSEETDVVLLDRSPADPATAEAVADIRRAQPLAAIVVVNRETPGEREIAAPEPGSPEYILETELSPKELRRTILHGMERMQLRRAAVRALELEGDLTSLVRHAKEAIIFWDREGTILAWNPAAETLYGYPAQQAIGMPIEAIVPEEARAEFQRSLARLVAGEPLPVWVAVRLAAGGREVEVEESLFPILDRSNQPTRIGAVARDRTELSRLRRVTQFLTESCPRALPSEIPATTSRKMQEVYEAACLVAQNSSATVLLLGETGVGKGWLARFLHARSPRQGKPFLEINCAGLAPQLVESELFGHEKGSFTGATSQKRGLVEAAEGGTLFLDEIGELPPEVQAQLLTFLDSRTFRRVGGNRTLTADVRLVAATNRDLRAAGEAGRFRPDLYYRLSVFPIEVPPIRERRGDIPRLAEEVLGDLVRRQGFEPFEPGEEVLGLLARYDWPGNIRELRNAFERALILSQGQRIEAIHLPAEVRGEARAPDSNPTNLAELERSHILRVLSLMDDNRTRAAKALGISRSTLRRKLSGLPERLPASPPGPPEATSRAPG